MPIPHYSCIVFNKFSAMTLYVNKMLLMEQYDTVFTKGKFLDIYEEGKPSMFTMP